MPKEMRCTACQAVSYQAALAVRATLAARYKDDLLGAITLEALQGLCASGALWAKEYGLMPTASGYNVYNGTGVTLPAGADFVNNDVMMSVAHTDTQGKKLAEVCMPCQSTLASRTLHHPHRHPRSLPSMNP